MHNQLDPKALFAAGFVDLISVAPPSAQLAATSRIAGQQLGKVPARRLPNGLYVGYDWRKTQHSAEDVARWLKMGSSVGLRADHWPMIDLDVTDEPLAQQLQDVAIEKLGAAPIRVGRWPKRLLLYRTDAPFGRMRLWIKDGDKHHLVEILGQGQQALVYGTHPSTSEPYWWNVASVTPQDLTTISRDQASAFLDDLAERLTLSGVAEVEREGDGRPVTHTPAANQTHLFAPSVEELRIAVAVVPNTNDLFPDRTSYIRMGYAIRAAAGAEEEEGLAIFAEWASRWEGNGRSPGGNDPDVVVADWRRMRGPFAVGWSWIADQAKVFGYNDAANDFEVVERAESDEQAATRPTDGERIAAISGDAIRAFFLEASELPDEQLLPRWYDMQIAPLIGDPLDQLFQRVLPEAMRADRFANELNRFKILLESRLEHEFKTHGASLADRSLLLRAAYALLAPLGSLVRGMSDSPGDPLSHDGDARDDLVEGWIPTRGLVALVGPPGHGKTFTALELAARIAKEPEVETLTHTPILERFANRPVQHGSAIYFTSEDAKGLRRRANKWAQRNGDITHLKLFGRVPALTDPASAIPFVLQAVDRAIAHGSPPLKLIVIDVARAAIHGDENSSEVMGAAMATANLVARMTGAAVLLVHHSPKANPSEGRGSSAFLGALDFQAAVESKDGLFTLTVVKNKHGPAGHKCSWQLQDEVLQPAMVNSPQKPQSVADECAAVAGNVIHALSYGTNGAARVDLVAKLRTELPELLGNGVPRTTRESRITDGLNRACESHLLIRTGRGKKQSFLPGPANVLEPVLVHVDAEGAI